MTESARVINRLSSGFDHLHFALAFILGFIWILVTRLYLNTGVLVALIGPLAILLTYSALLWQPQFRLREDRAADNLYYLGFLFTVISLGVALYRYDSETKNVDSIINDLGVGLTTTVVGLFLRIFFSQLRLDPEEMGEAARADLAQGLEKFRGDVNQLAQVLRVSQNIFAQQLKESHNRLMFLSQNTEKALDELNQKITNTELPPDAFLKLLASSSDKFGKALNDLAEKIEGIEFDISPFDQSMRSSSAKVEKSVSALATKIASIDLEASGVMRNFYEQLSAVARELGEISPAVSKAATMLSEEIEPLRSAASDLKSHSETLRLVTRDNTQIISSLGSLKTNLSGLEELNRDLQNVGKALQSVSNTIQSEAGKLSSSGNLSTNRYNDLNQSIDHANRQTQALANNISDLSSQFSETLTQLIKIANAGLRKR